MTHSKLSGSALPRWAVLAQWVVSVSFAIAACTAGSAIDSDVAQGMGIAASPNASKQPTVEPNTSTPPIGAPQTPANPNSAGAMAAGPAETSYEGEGNFVIAKPFVTDANMQVIDGVAQGTWCEFTVNSDTSAFYTGEDPNLSRSYKPINRTIYVYTPADYVAGTTLPLMVGHDGMQSKNFFTHVLDNLIAKRALPPMAAVCIDNGGGDGPGSERGLEYDVVSDKFVNYIEAELLPLASQKCHVAFTSDPAGRAAFGTSSGAAAAMSMGWFHPELYGRIITYSATLVNQWPTPQEPNGAWAYPGHLISETPRKNLRIYLEVGSNDLNAGKNDVHDWVLANKTMASVLAAKKYHHQFFYAEGGGHVDGGVVGQTLPAALTWAWKGYAAP